MLANVCKSDVNVCKCLQMFANGCKCLQMSVMVTRRAFSGCGRFRERIPGVARGTLCCAPAHAVRWGKQVQMALQILAVACKCLQMFANVRRLLANVRQCLPMIAGYIWMFASGCKCLQMFANVCKCLQIVCKCLQMLANVCQWV